MEVGIWEGCVEMGRLGRIEVGIWGGCVEMGRLGRVCSTKY